MSIFPTPGEVDVVIASELMECGRAIQRGFATPDRTTLITSTNRVYSIDEKMAAGDGRVDDDELLAAAARSSKRLVAADFAAIADDAGVRDQRVAVWGARRLRRAPVHPRAVRGADPGVRQRASRRPWRRSRRASTPPQHRLRPSNGGPATATALPITTWTGTSRSVEADEGRRGAATARDRGHGPGGAGRPGSCASWRSAPSSMPAAARSMILHGLVRTAVYQDRAYAERYLAAGRPLRRARARSRWRGPPDASRRSPHRAVDVLPGHDPGRPAEDPAGPDRARPRGGQGEARPALRGARVPAPPDRRDHRHDCRPRSAPACAAHARSSGSSVHR